MKNGAGSSRIRQPREDSPVGAQISGRKRQDPVTSSNPEKISLVGVDLDNFHWLLPPGKLLPESTNTGLIWGDVSIDKRIVSQMIQFHSTLSANRAVWARTFGAVPGHCYPPLHRD